MWIETGKSNGLVESSIRQCRQHLELHIKPHLGSTKLSKLTVPMVRAFEEWLRVNGRSLALTKKVLSSLGGIVADAMERGLAARNPVREMRKVRKHRRTKATRERKKKFVVGVDIPTPAEIKAILEAATRPGSNRYPGFRRAFLRDGRVGRLARLRTARATLDGCGLHQGCDQRRPARGQVGHD